MPLAIELAASRVRVLSCEAIADEIERNALPVHAELGRKRRDSSVRLVGKPLGLAGGFLCRVGLGVGFGDPVGKPEPESEDRAPGSAGRAEGDNGCKVHRTSYLPA